MLYLKEANFEDAEKEYLFVKDIPSYENSFTNDWYNVSYDDFINKALKQMISSSEGENLPDGYVPETFFFLWNDNEIIGQFRLRHYLCESLKSGSGHIGYFIGKDFRGRGYAKEGLRLLLEVARKTIPEEEIRFRVDKENTASLKVILSNGGYIAEEDNEKYYIRIKK